MSGRAVSRAVGRALACAACAALAASAGAATTTIRAYSLPGGGAVEVAVPVRWQESLRYDAATLQPTVRLTDPAGEPFELLLTCTSSGGGGSLPRAALEEAALAAARSMLGLPADASLPALTLAGREGEGVVITVTDPAVPDPPPAGAYRSLTQAAVPLGDGVVSATILTQRPWSLSLDLALGVVRSARTGRGAGDPWRQPGRTPEAPLSGLGSAFDLGEIPDGLVLETRHPLRLTHAETGARLVVTVAERSSDARHELRRLRRDAERRPEGSWILRRARTREWSGREAAELELVDERLGILVQRVAAPVGKLVVEASWEAPARMASESESVRERGLGAVMLKVD